MTIRMTLTALALALACGPALAKSHHHGGNPPPPPPPPFTGSLDLTASNWDDYQTSNVPLTNVSGALTFNFPSSGHFDYLWSRQAIGSIAAAHAFTMTFAIVGSGAITYAPNGCIFPASVRFIMGPQTAGPYTSDEYERWWSNPVHAVLQAGQWTITAPLTPDQWSDVYGHFGTDSPQALAGWQAVVANPQVIGMTFGGGCFFGHGVEVTGGSAEFELLSYSVQ